MGKQVLLGKDAQCEKETESSRFHGQVGGVFISCGRKEPGELLLQPKGKVKQTPMESGVFWVRVCVRVHAWHILLQVSADSWVIRNDLEEQYISKEESCCYSMFGQPYFQRTTVTGANVERQTSHVPEYPEREAVKSYKQKGEETGFLCHKWKVPQRDGTPLWFPYPGCRSMKLAS